MNRWMQEELPWNTISESAQERSINFELKDGRLDFWKKIVLELKKINKMDKIKIQRHITGRDKKKAVQIEDGIT